MIKATVQTIESLPGRVLAASDIHGEWDLLQSLLEKADFGGEDTLFLVGDLVEKGRESLKTLRSAMAFAQTHRVYVVNGNCDDLVAGFVDGREELTEGFFRYYMGVFKERCTLIQMGREAGLTDGEMEDYPSFRAVLRERFRPELDFLRRLPTVIDTPNLLFVHGGVPEDRDMARFDAWRCMKNDHFAQQESKLSKWTVVGHTPTTLYRPRVPSANPYISPEKKLISIDGGCAIKPDGQINLLLFPHGRGEAFTLFAADLLPTVTALDAQERGDDGVNIRWGHHAVALLERGEEFSRCRHVESGREVAVLTDYLYTGKDGGLYCEDFTSHALGVSPGDTLSLVRRTSRGLLVKKDGVTGWYRGRAE